MLEDDKQSYTDMIIRVVSVCIRTLILKILDFPNGIYLLFAHRFFRRNLSILNSTNEEFFNSFEKMRSIPDAEMQIALDMDMIGLIGTENIEQEYQYIRGPHFNDDLSCIPKGVTCHENEYYDNCLSNLLSTQFYWHVQDGRRTFECEELCDRESYSALCYNTSHKQIP